MRYFYKRILPVCLAVLFVLSLAGCGQGNGDSHTTGITIEKDPAYSTEVQALAEETVHALVIYAYTQAATDKIPAKVEARLANYAQRVSAILSSVVIPEARYREVLATLEAKAPDVIDELLAAKAGETVDYQKTRALYLDLTYAFGAENVATMLYELCLFIYDARYERTVEKWEEYQYPWYQEEAEALKAEKETFTEGIQKDSFGALVGCTAAMAELLSVSPEGLADSFSDAEVLEILHHLKVSQIDITPKGWELLLSYLPAGKAGSYTAKLSAAFHESGDLGRLSTVMSDAIALVASAMDKLLPEDIAALRAGDREALIGAIFSRFDEADWALFASLTSIPFDNAQYSALAIEQYGSQAYLSYIASLTPVSLAELRAAVGSAEFYQTLTNYLAAICPAISYEVNS